MGDDLWTVYNNCPKRWEIKNDFSSKDKRTPVIEYRVACSQRRLILRLEFDTFTNPAHDCFNMYIDEFEEPYKRFTPFMFSIWIEGRDKKKYFYSKILVNKLHLLIWSVKRYRLFQMCRYLKKIQNINSKILPFVFMFEPVSNIKEENDSAKNLEGTVAKETVIEDVITRCRSLLAKFTKPDLVLVTGDDTFSVNKMDLQDRCENFAEAMLANSDNGKVKVTDMDSVVLAVLLMHIYSKDSTNFSAEIAPKVFRASIKYKLKELVVQSISLMAGRLTEKDIMDLLSFAITCENEFMCNVIYSMRYPKQIFRSDAWYELSPKRIEWACKVYLSYFTKRLQ